MSNRVYEPVAIMTAAQIIAIDRMITEIAEGETRAGYILIQIQNGHIHKVYPAPLVFLPYGDKIPHDEQHER